MKTTMRNYHAKDVDMLIASATIIESAIANKTALQAKRSTWADPFFEDIKISIDKAIQQHLGTDSVQKLRQSTTAIRQMQERAINDLAELKVQLVEDFRKDPSRQKEMLAMLGFTPYYKGVQRRDQEALINLLYQFKTNLTPELKAEISSTGIPPQLVYAIVNHADIIKNADITQEGHKGTRKEITAEAIAEFNNIYEEVMSIANISKRFFKGNPALQEQFSFNKVSKTLNRKKSSKAVDQP